MKSILAGILFLSWTASCQPSTLTNDTSFCLPISKARLLLADALKLNEAESMLEVSAKRIVLIENQLLSSQNSYSNLLKIEQDKYKTAVEKSVEMQKINQSFQQQLSGVQKNERRHKREKVALGGALVVVIVLALIK